MQPVMNNPLDIVFIGAGNVATHLAPAFRKEGHRILQVYSRTRPSAEYLASRTGARAIDRKESVSAGADLYVLALTDEGILEFIREFSIPNAMVVHTSGGLEMSILKGLSDRFGVLYPLQTFSKDKGIDFQSIPILVEGSDRGTEDQLYLLADQISGVVHRIDSEHRQKLHLAAVFACNFTNHMYDISARLVEKEGLKFDLLKPLITETASKILDKEPRQVQTGPAARNDKKVIEKHLELLSFNPLMRDIYQLLTESIRKRNTD